MIAASEKIGVVATIDPDAYAANTYLTDAVDLSKFGRYLFIVTVGDLATGATVDFELQGATSSGGSYADIATNATAITQLTQAGTDGDKQVVVELDPVYIENLGLGYTHVKGKLVVGTDAADAAVVVLGVGPRYGPAADHDLTSVDEILTFVN